MKKQKKKNRKKHHSNPNTQKKKQRDFESQGASSQTNIEAITNERIRLYAVYGILGLGIVLGFILALVNVRDEAFSISFKNLHFNCTLVGVAICLFCIWTLIKYNPKIKIKDEK